MNTKTEINDILESLIYQLRTYSSGVTAITASIYRISDLIGECVYAQVVLVDLPDNSKELLEFKNRVFILETKINRLSVFLFIMPATLAIYALMGVLFFMISYINIPEFIKSTLGVEAPVKLSI